MRRSAFQTKGSIWSTILLEPTSPSVVSRVAVVLSQLLLLFNMEDFFGKTGGLSWAFSVWMSVCGVLLTCGLRWDGSSCPSICGKTHVVRLPQKLEMLSAVLLETTDKKTDVCFPSQPLLSSQETLDRQPLLSFFYFSTIINHRLRRFLLKPQVKKKIWNFKTVESSGFTSNF